MYTSKFRDKVYEDQHGTPPWTALEHKEQTVSLLSEYLPQTVEWKHILDYWCWDGKIWEHFLKMWADLDFAEISDKMVELLRKKYLYQSELLDAVWNGVDNTRKVQVYKVETPHDIPDKESYDYIISRCVFHHIDPKLWKDFIDELMAHLKKWGKLMIWWWDISDDVLKQDGQLWHVTWQHSRWFATTYRFGYVWNWRYMNPCREESYIWYE